MLCYSEHSLYFFLTESWVPDSLFVSSRVLFRGLYSQVIHNTSVLLINRPTSGTDSLSFWSKANLRICAQQKCVHTFTERHVVGVHRGDFCKSQNLKTTQVPSTVGGARGEFWQVVGAQYILCSLTFLLRIC